MLLTSIFPFCFSPIAADLSKKKKTILLDKVKIIQKLEKGSKQIDEVKELGHKHWTVVSVWLKRKSVMDIFESENIMGSKWKFRGPGHPILESALLKWFVQIHSQNIAINGPFFKAKALKMAKLLNIISFSFMRFKNQHGQVFKTVNGKVGNLQKDKIRVENEFVIPSEVLWC